MDSDFFTRQYEETYGTELAREVEGLLGSQALTEAFFGVYAQLDLLVVEDDVDLTSAEHYDRNEWTPRCVVNAAQEMADLARRQEKPSAGAIATLARVLSEMIGDARIRAQIRKAAQDDDDSLVSVLKEKERCLAIIRDGLGKAIEKAASGEGQNEIDERNVSASSFIEVDEDGNLISDPQVASAAAAPSQQPSGDQPPKEEPKKITTASGLVIRLE